MTVKLSTYALFYGALASLISCKGSFILSSSDDNRRSCSSSATLASSDTGCTEVPLNPDKIERLSETSTTPDTTPPQIDQGIGRR